ncbi:MAG: 2-oxoacid:acceptor oxidoreductase family protein, partial [Candidatus Thermoplasmatota archaeon]|nr:2-oxoacid:acceptor oxidoreductase family protein [Candidatus Thermoplasmatota archaeon]
MGKVVNDFTINIATANGTGSQSANLILLQSIFDMGINISGKNLFPSNISGLPTWYILRISDHGYQAPGDVTNIQVLVNKDTWEADLGAVEPGTVVVWNSDAKMAMDREDVISYPVPMTKMARTLNPKLAKLVTNIIYVGVLAEMLGIEQSALESAVEKQFSGKASAIELNTKALSLGRDYAKDELEKQDEFVLEARVRDQKQFFIEGNEAAALGAIYGGVQLL